MKFAQLGRNLHQLKLSKHDVLPACAMLLGVIGVAEFVQQLSFWSKLS
jgi:hypothetical protein